MRRSNGDIEVVPRFLIERATHGRDRLQIQGTIFNVVDDSNHLDRMLSIESAQDQLPKRVFTGKQFPCLRSIQDCATGFAASSASVTVRPAIRRAPSVSK